MNNIELLSPAGDEESFKAAILAGCNAIYFGFEKFNARQRAKNISNDKVLELVALAKSYNVKCYLTLNIILFDDEFEVIKENIEFAIQIGIDAVIVQDLGLIHFIKKQFPHLQIHASTQLTTHNLEQCKLLVESGVSQVNLSRELSLEQLKPLVKYLNENNVVAEIFVHGAYCISFSGQCYFSNYLYGEAGNRGNCVQPCRREFYLTKTNCNVKNNYEEIKNSLTKTPFNLKDNSAFCLAKELFQLGNISIKIEGRIKGFDYVYAVTKAWRNQIDLFSKELNLENDSELLNNSMNRLFSHDYLSNTTSSNMFTYGMKDHSYSKECIVKNYNPKNGEIVLSVPVSVGDKINIYQENTFICSGEIGETITLGNKLNVSTKNYGIIKENQKCFIQKDSIGRKCVKQQISELKKKRKLLTFEFHGDLNENLKVTCKYNNKEYCVVSTNQLTKAKNKSINNEVLYQQFGRLGDTDFELKNVITDNLSKDLFLTLSEMNELKRNLVKQLNEDVKENVISINDQKIIIKLIDTENKTSIITNKKFFLVSTIEQYELLDNETKVSCVLEIPSYIEKESSLLQKILFLISEQKVVPYFNAIYFDDDFWIVEKISRVLPKNQIVFTENLGIARYLNQYDFRIVLGSQVNIANKYACEFVKKYSCAIIPSCEVSENRMYTLMSNKNYSFCYFNKKLNLLMQSKQCLVHNLSSCTKLDYDNYCKFTCNKKLNAVNPTGDEIEIFKRPGFYSAMYSHKQLNNNYLILEKESDFELIDLRFN